MKKNTKLLIWLLSNIVVALAVRYGFEVLFIAVSKTFNLSISFNLISRTFFTFLVVLIWLLIVLRSEYINSKLPWLIVLTLEPFVGLALFLTFGRSYINSYRFKRRPFAYPTNYLVKEPQTDFTMKRYTNIDSEITDIYKNVYNTTHHHAYYKSDKVTILQDGSEKFPRLIQELKEAKDFILMQYYIIRTDTIGRQVLSILKDKAKEGVKVYLLYDAIGSVFVDKEFLKDLQKSNVKIVKNEPVFFGFFNTKVNYRNHRKITIIDGQKAFVGGLNLGDEYNNLVQPFGYFRDTHLLIEGASVASLTQVFFRDYYYNTKKKITDDFYYPETNIKGKGLVQVVPSGPDFLHPPIRNMYVKMINNAKESIKIMTPYLALDQELLTSLIIAAKSGVHIQMILPGIPDKKSIYIVTKSFIHLLLEVGIEVYTFDSGFVHSKVLMIDDHLASCGTYNLDNRSARINFEVTILLYNEGVDQLVEDFNEDIKRSSIIDPNSWMKRPVYKRLVEGILNIFSPLV